MASPSFRDSINSLGWSRRAPDEPGAYGESSTPTPFVSTLQSLNPFASRGVQLPSPNGSAAPLPAPTRREEEEGWFACESCDPCYCRIGSFYYFVTSSWGPLYLLGKYSSHLSTCIHYRLGFHMQTYRITFVTLSITGRLCSYSLLRDILTILLTSSRM